MWYTRAQLTNIARGLALVNQRQCSHVPILLEVVEQTVAV